MKILRGKLSFSNVYLWVTSKRRGIKFLEYESQCFVIFFFRFSVTYLGCQMCLGATSTNPSKINLIYILSEAGKLRVVHLDF